MPLYEPFHDSVNPLKLVTKSPQRWYIITEASVTASEQNMRNKLLSVRSGVKMLGTQMLTDLGGINGRGHGYVDKFKYTRLSVP